MAPGWQPWTAIKAPMDPADTDGRFSGYQRIAATPPSSSYSYSCLLVKSLHFCHQVILQDLRRRKKFIIFIVSVNSLESLDHVPQPTFF